MWSSSVSKASFFPYKFKCFRFDIYIQNNKFWKEKKKKNLRETPWIDVNEDIIIFLIEESSSCAKYVLSIFGLVAM